MMSCSAKVGLGGGGGVGGEGIWGIGGGMGSRQCSGALLRVNVIRAVHEHEHA